MPDVNPNDAGKDPSDAGKAVKAAPATSPAPAPKRNGAAPAPKQADSARTKAAADPGDSASSAALQDALEENIARVVQNLVNYVEPQIAGLEAAPLGKRGALLPTFVNGITGRLQWAQSQIEQLKKKAAGGGSPLAVAPHVEQETARLSNAMRKLSTMAKNGQLRMAETGLAAMFDAEDELLHQLGGTLIGRANDFYGDPSEKGASPSTDTTHTPSALEVAGDLKQGATKQADKPTTRAGFLTQIPEGAKSRLMFAYMAGNSHAERTITEPTPGPNPGKLQSVLNIVLAMLSATAFGALGKSISIGLNGLSAVKGLEAVAGEDIKNILVDAVKKGGETAMKEAGGMMAASAASGSSTGGGALSPKTRFLEHAMHVTKDGIINANARIADLAPKLHRLPTEILSELSQMIDGGFDAFEIAYGQLLLREWVNFVKAATEAGVISAGDSHLDGLLDPKGVLRIDMAVRGNIVSLTDMSRNKVSGVEVREVRLPGVTPAVLEDLAKQPYTLQSFPIHRKIVVSMSDQLVPIEFTVSRDFQIDPPKHLSRIQMELLAKIAGFAVPGERREVYSGADAMPMLNIVFAHLSQVPASRINP